VYVYYVYILQCTDGTLYTGITTDLNRRLKEHRSGVGGSFTRSKKVEKIAYSEESMSRSDALKREAEIKRWKREKKLELINRV
jgi:putative endonuclease